MQSLRNQIKNLPSKKTIDKKHQEVERFFKRGIIQTGLIIEVHRQMVEFEISKSELEMEAIQSKLEIFRLNGNINKLSF